MKYLFLIIIFFSIAFLQCSPSVTQVENLIIIESERTFDSIPSGSGMAVKGDSLFIISDDAPYVFSVFLKDNSFRKIHITDLPHDEYRMSKNSKPDFEAAFAGKIYGQQAIIAFGSGSKDIERETLFILNDSGQLNISLTALYSYLRKKTNTAAKEWNIEGAALVGDTLMLGNRGNNMIINIPWKSFTDYLFGFDQMLPFVNFYKIKLPFIAGHEARIAGICPLDETHALLCASVEDTKDWSADGPVLGSHIAVLDIKSRKIISEYVLADSTGNVLKEKIESVEFLNKDAEGTITLLAITDNDDGKTKMFRLKISRQ